MFEGSRRFHSALPVVFLALMSALSVSAQGPPEPPSPVPDAKYSNLFYGAIPPGGNDSSVLVFVPGLLEIAQMWWDIGGNDMYAYAYQAGFRTAFMSPNALNVPVTSDSQTNAAMLEKLMPAILAHYNVSQVYFISHSLGGLDVQQMLANPKYLGLAKSVFTLSSPNQGDALANWLFSVLGEPTGIEFGLLVPGVQEVETQTVKKLRTKWDPIFQASRIPFYTLGGDNYFGNPMTIVTGPVLQSLAGPNDGVVSVSESMLPSTYSLALGVINGNHFEVPLGHNAWPYIAPHLNVK